MFAQQSVIVNRRLSTQKDMPLSRAGSHVSDIDISATVQDNNVATTHITNIRTIHDLPHSAISCK